MTGKLKAHIILVFVCLAAISVPGCKNLEKTESAAQSKQEVFHRRDGLSNLFYKISTQRQIRIAYLGGSITAASEGWRDLTFSWFRLKYPQTSFYQINSTIGGTGSFLGVFQLDAVLAEKPDLLFVEFAVNDENEMSVNRRVQAMEGIVRKTWEALPNTDIFFIYTTAVKFCTILIQEGRQFDAVLDHEKIADYYGIPSVDLGREVAMLCAQGKVTLTADPSENSNSVVVFSNTDHYHPLTESGHPLYAGKIAECLLNMSKNSAEVKHILSVPYIADNWQRCQMIYPEKTEMQGDWIKIPEIQQIHYGTTSGLWKAGKGAVMKFCFDGNELGIFDCIGPGTGKIEVTVDGKGQELNRFDSFCTYWRSNAVFLDKLPSGVHHVEIRVTGSEFDKKPVMKSLDDPDQYKAFDWYPIGLLITGNLKPAENNPNETN